MIRPDLICVWPDTIDFPLFREWVHKERARFSKVIIVFTETNWPFTNLTNWIQETMKQDDVSFVMNDPVENRDWRDVATKKGLTISDSEWVFFTEPDFFPQPGFWSFSQSLMNTYRAVGVKQGERLHPCCLFLSRALLSEIHKDFSANPPEYDHFGFIQKELKDQYVGTIPPMFWQHMNGLSHNMFLLQSGEKPVYMPKEFRKYLQKCLLIDLPLHEGFIKTIKEYIS